MNVDETKPLRIKNWSPEDRPREKLILKGSSALTDAELLAVLIGSGTVQLSAVEVSKKILQHVDFQLHELARLSVKDLTRMKGIGEAKAVAIVAALELGRRRKDNHVPERPKVESSRDAFAYIASDLSDLPHEEFWILLMNRANKIIGKKRISAGGVSGTIADPKLIFKMALEQLACSLIVAHNHPSGNLKASQSDIDLTRRLKEAGKLLEIQLLDHLIVSGGKYFSFADEGLL